MSLSLCTGPTSEMRPSCSFLEDTSPRSIQLRRSRAMNAGRIKRSQIPRSRSNEEIMRPFCILLITCRLACAKLSQAQSNPAVESPAPVRTYHLLREDDDWSFLADPAQRQDFWDPIKYIPLRSGQSDWFLSMGGEAREVWEQIGNDNWGQQPFMNGYFNKRYMFHFDVHYGKHVRSFVELKSGLNSYRIGGPRPIDEKKMDFQTAFLE